MTVPSFNSAINISIATEDVTTVVSLLLSNRIFFSLTTANFFEQYNNDVTYIKEECIDNSKLTKLSTPTLSTVEAVYQKYLVEEIAQVPPSEKQIATEIGISLLKFKNAFKIAYGKPFYQLYMEKRMEYAAQLLQKGHRANKVSTMVGYGENSCIKFNKMFQKHFGMTPKKYQLLYAFQ